MLKLVTRTLALLALVVVLVVPATASARIALTRSAPESGALTIQPVSQPSTSGGFDWTAAAIGAGATLLVAGMGTGAGVAGRRRRASRAAIA